MKFSWKFSYPWVISIGLGIFCLSSLAANHPAPVEGDWVVKDFKFHTGETLPQLRLHYTTVGHPSGEPVLVLHGTTGSGMGMVNGDFAGELFGPGQALDASRYFIILPDAVGTGKSSKPSDGLRMQFPRYNYEDMVLATYRLLTEHLGIQHVRLVIGNSMGGMETWLMAQRYPGFLDVAVPMASLPIEMSGRNWMLRRLIIDSIRNDPQWLNGSYTQQPPSLRFASVFYALATNGGNQGLYKLAPTRAKADALLNQRLQGNFAGDANDHLYQWEASGDYSPNAGLEKIQAHVLAINSSDDERNPVEFVVLEREIPRIKNGNFYIIPGNPDTAGHGTTAKAKFWQAELRKLLQSAPRQ